LASNLRSGITLCIAAHPQRLSNGLLSEALDSVMKQTLQPDTIIIVNDIERAGAGRTRQKLLRMVETEWMAWLDSDDRLLPKHLEKLMQAAQDTDAVFVNSWFFGIFDPLGHYGKSLNPCDPHHTTITFMVKTELAQEVGFPDSTLDEKYSNEDWAHISGIAKLCCERGLTMTHLAERTWYWTQGANNSSGLPTRGDAAL
jgi:glycosyltransferase involved in cell wall biosynthesis